MRNVRVCNARYISDLGCGSFRSVKLAKTCAQQVHCPNGQNCRRIRNMLKRQSTQ
jgi:hypothetical protein